MIEVKNIHKSFGEAHVLKGISAKFKKGETSLIIGQSGSGKTVFIKTLLGLHNPDKGCICYDGVDYDQMSNDEKRELRKQIGMVFQGSALFDSSNVEENVMFPLKMFTEQSREEMLERVNFVLKRVDLVNANQKFPAELSGGMQKRVAIARAIVMNPKYLFCDEPNSGLDPKTAILIDNLIQEITDEYNITTVINTHDMNSVMEIGEKIIFLKDGIKEWEGSNKDIFITNNKAVTDFVYSSNLFKKVRKIYLMEAEGKVGD
jgi:phospholipid/cholesterol/gamma-HCH transport system ATP-binding protein